MGFLSDIADSLLSTENLILPGVGFIVDYMDDREAEAAGEMKKAEDMANLKAQNDRRKRVKEAYSRRRRAQGYGISSVQSDGNAQTSLLMKV